MKTRELFQADANQVSMCNVRQQKKIYLRQVRLAKCSWCRSFFVENVIKEPHGGLRNLNCSDRCATEMVAISMNTSSFREPTDIATALGENFFPDLFEPLTCIQSTLSGGVAVNLNTLSQMEIAEIFDEELHEAVFSMTRKRAPGEDGIQPFILQDLYALLKPYLTVIFNKCIVLKYFRRQWTRAVVIPLPKRNR